MPDRLQKILAHAGVASRRAAEGLITGGRVTVNGSTVTALGTRADAKHDDIRVDGRRLHPPARHRYILLHKPRGVVTTRSDPEGRRTVMDLIAGIKDALYPVGRLDYDSEGLLLLTNDGDLTARLTHPRHGVSRTYEVQVRGVPDGHALERLARGVTVEGRRTTPSEVRLVHPLGTREGTQATLRVTVWEGRNRQVRNMCDAIGHPVIRLRRVSIGPLTDERLKPGAFRDLRPDELRALQRAASGTAAEKVRLKPAATEKPQTLQPKAGRLESRPKARLAQSPTTSAKATVVRRSLVITDERRRKPKA